METTGKAFIEHWSWAAGKGLMNANTAHGTRAACRQVLGVVDDWENADIKRLDVEQTLTKFQNLKKKEFKPQVLETYKRRFKHAVTQYLDYLENPSSWKPGQERKVRQRSNDGRKPAPRAHDEAVAGEELPSARMVEYPFPLREGQNARLVLPRDLKASELKRLSAFMAALVVENDEGK